MDKTIADSDLLLCGLGFTSRTETIEDYLKDKVGSLTVVGISSCFLKENLSFCRYYESGELKKEFKVPNLRIKDYKWYRQPLMPFVVMMYFVSICIAVLRVRMKFDVYVGVSHTFGLFGIMLKIAGVAKSVIYYCIDYYVPTDKFDFHSYFTVFLNGLDHFVVKNADLVWDLSARIAEFRYKIAGAQIGSYRNAIVPLGYSKTLRKVKPMSEVDRWRIGFVGSVTANQGLQLLLEALPDVLKELPQVRVTVIGQGPFLGDFRSMVSQKGLDKYFTFLGFIKDEQEMLEILSTSALAVALYSDSIENKNIICADPGKTKLYALRGLPIITTKSCSLGEEIVRDKAGLVIDYNKDELKKAVCYLMASEERLKEYRDNSYRLGEKFISDSIFNEAVVKQWGSLTQSKLIYDCLNPQIVKYILDESGHETRVLDVGCATGRLGKVLKSRINCYVKGIEIDKEAASMAAECYDEVTVLDLEELMRKKCSFEDKSKYDFIVFGDILEHVSDPQALLNCFSSLLKDDGFLIASIPNVANWMVRLGLLFGKFDYTGGILDAGHLRFFTYKSARKLLEEGGYRIISVVNNNRTTLIGSLGRIWISMFAFQFVFKCRKAK